MRDCEALFRTHSSFPNFIHVVERSRARLRGLENWDRRVRARRHHVTLRGMRTFTQYSFVKSVSRVAAAALALCLVPSMARAQDADFSKQGHLAISSDANVGLVGTSTNNDGGSSLKLTLQPAVDYFVIDNLSLGGFVLYSHESSSPGGGGPSSHSDTFGVGPRIGYNIPLSDTLSFWPKAYVQMAYSTAYSGGSSTDMTWDVGGYAPLVVHPAPHFFLGLGPYVQTEFANTVSANNQSQTGPKTTEYGLQFTVGGWTGL
jgi:hypothetical protein